MGHEPGAQGLIRSGPILDDDFLADVLRHRRLDQTRNDIDAAAGWRSHDQFDEAGWKFLATCEAVRVYEQRGCQQ
jgi:hypothetical protein